LYFLPVNFEGFPCPGITPREARLVGNSKTGGPSSSSLGYAFLVVIGPSRFGIPSSPGLPPYLSISITHKYKVFYQKCL
jgi:hypothetical protein